MVSKMFAFTFFHVARLMVILTLPVFLNSLWIGVVELVIHRHHHVVARLEKLPLLQAEHEIVQSIMSTNEDVN